MSRVSCLSDSCQEARHGALGVCLAKAEPNKLIASPEGSGESFSFLQCRLREGARPLALPSPARLLGAEEQSPCLKTVPLSSALSVSWSPGGQW